VVKCLSGTEADGRKTEGWFFRQWGITKAAMENMESGLMEVMDL
jgi:hypothetical protein